MNVLCSRRESKTHAGANVVCCLPRRRIILVLTLLYENYLKRKGSSMLLKLFCVVMVAAPALSQTHCEVCVKVLKDCMAKVEETEKSKPESIAKAIRDHCKDSRNKDHKFCFYIGALPESATSIMGDVSKQLSWSMPPEKVCDKMKSKDAQICELKYDKPLDWKTIDLKKMRVKELKNILNEWGEICKGCTEKSEFVRRIEELKPKYVKEEL